MSQTVRLSPDDNVVTALRPLEAGVDVEGAETLSLIPRGHKIACRPIAKGEPIRKYGQIIGYAAEDLAPGRHLHTDEIEFRNTQQEYEFGTDLRPVQKVATPDTFMGYRRPSGKSGTRNHIAILSSVNCSATAAQRIAAHFTPEILADYPNVDGVTAFSHGTGCASHGEGFENLQRIMWGYARHPNVAGVLFVGLGCEGNQIDWLLEAYGLQKGPLCQVLNIQDVAGLRRTVEKGVERIAAMLPEADAIAREPCPVSDLVLALQCGGSDAWSGISANPALGHATDLLVAQGGAGLLAETPEIYGAEHLLTRRAATPEIGQALIERIRWWEDYTERNRASMDNNPSPGNKRGGLSTILEKSLGAAAKGGTTPLQGVFKYAHPVEKTRGFLFMDSPGYDPASVTGQIASGCNLVAFTTGRGSAFGSKPAPTIKLATNSELARKMPEDMDIDCGPILTGEKTVEQMGAEIYATLLRVASGERTLSEAQGLGDHEFVPWQIGATM
ncbi:MAG: altronate dehydratase family protein [Pseudomonadota bacterium]